MFFSRRQTPEKTVAELPTQNQCVSCRVTLSEADFPPNLTLAKLHGFLLETADGRYFAASTGNRPFSVNLLTDWMEPAPCPEPDPEPESIPAPEPEAPSVLAEEKCASRQKKPHNLANRLPAYANSVMRISPPCKTILAACQQQLSAAWIPQLPSSSFTGRRRTPVAWCSRYLFSP